MAKQNPTISPADLYLNLLKKTLTYSMWPQPPWIVRHPRGYLAWLKRLIVTVLEKRGYVLAKIPPFAEQVQAERGDWYAYADTMIGLKRLDNLQYCIEAVLKDKVPGDFIETGVWRGGACIFMRGVMAAFAVTDRKVFVADSFQGLPKSEAASPVDEGIVWHQFRYLAVPRPQVERNFDRYSLLDIQVVFLEGWFDETLPTASIETLAILRLDGELYNSTIIALEHLYPKLSSGGFCIIDDYGLPGARTAVTDYRKQHGISEPIIPIDYMSVYWRKE